MDHGIGYAHDIVLRRERQGLILMNTGICFECVFDGELDAGFVEGNDPPIAFADGESLALKGIELGQLGAGIRLFVQHVE